MSGGHRDTAEHLLENGADVGRANADGDTALHKVRENGWRDGERMDGGTESEWMGRKGERTAARDTGERMDGRRRGWVE